MKWETKSTEKPQKRGDKMFMSQEKECVIQDSSQSPEFPMPKNAERFLGHSYTTAVLNKSCLNKVKLTILGKD